MTLQQHKHLRLWFPLSFAIAVFVLVTFLNDGEILGPTPTVSFSGILSFFVLQFAIGLLPAECPKCGGRMRFAAFHTGVGRKNIINEALSRRGEGLA